MGSLARPDWTEQEITKLKELCDSGLYRFDTIAKMLGRSHRGTMYKCYEQGFNNRYHVRLYSHDEAFFSKVTYETCYWAAILATDGCISIKNGYPTIVWAIAVKDKAHMEMFKETARITNPIKHSKNVCLLSTKDPTTLHENCRLSIDATQQWVKDLSSNFGITNNKTLRCPPPTLPTIQHKLSYIRGFIDGDGSITCSNQEGFISIMVCGCNRELISWIKDTIDSLDLPHIHPAKRPSLIYQPEGESCYYYCLRGFRAAVLFELLRRLPVPCLSRKWDNPRTLQEVNHWKEQSDKWPPESFFDKILGPCLLVYAVTSI